MTKIPEQFIRAITELSCRDQIWIVQQLNTKASLAEHKQPHPLGKGKLKAATQALRHTVLKAERSHG